MTDAEVRELVAALASGARVERRHDGGWRLTSPEGLVALASGDCANEAALRRGLEDACAALRLMAAALAQVGADAAWRADIEGRLAALERKTHGD
jgi:hypothetical protein